MDPELGSAYLVLQSWKQPGSGVFPLAGLREIRVRYGKEMLLRGVVQASP